LVSLGEKKKNWVGQPIGNTRIQNNNLN